MNWTSEHFEIIDLYNITPDSVWNVDTDPFIIDLMFLDGLAVELASEDAPEMP